MNIYLERYGSTPHGVFGELVIGDHMFYTVERPWLDNKPFKSCIPNGEYDLKPFTRQNGDKVYALVNEDITYHEEPGCTRYSVLMHKANTMDDLAGCIAPGTGLGFIKNKWAVLNSSFSMGEIMRLLPEDEDHHISIRWQKNGE